ncbi:hypothetical protein NGA_2098220, partial [Nannochloropsis gaditana CCMP526]|uniref:uncharacterized protein n=1 Tax=Nannochloropsis gaditana (strain CCMP526) TaxID=1093141 RepID=UPI00029F71FC
RLSSTPGSQASIQTAPSPHEPRHTPVAPQEGPIQEHIHSQSIDKHEQNSGKEQGRVRARRRFQQGHDEGQREVAGLQEVRWHQDQSNGHAHNQHGQTATSSTRTTPLVNASGQPPPCQRVQGREKEVGKGVPLEDPPPKVEDVVPVVGEEEG